MVFLSPNRVHFTNDGPFAGTLSCQTASKNDLSGFDGYLFGGVDGHLRVRRGDVGVVDARDALDEPGPDLGVQAFSVALLADLKGRIHESFDEPSGLADEIAVCTRASG